MTRITISGVSKSDREEVTELAEVYLGGEYEITAAGDDGEWEIDTWADGKVVEFTNRLRQFGFSVEAEDYG